LSIPFEPKIFGFIESAIFSRLTKGYSSDFLGFTTNGCGASSPSAKRAIRPRAATLAQGEKIVGLIRATEKSSSADLTFPALIESLILAQDERWRRA